MALRITGVVVLSALVAACSSATTSPTPAGTPSGASADDAGDGTSVDAPTVTAYTEAEVQQLFDARCVRCHRAGNTSVDLSAPFTKDTIGIATRAGFCGRSKFKVHIVPGNREASLLWHKVKGTQDCGSAMPYDAGNKPLDATELERLGLYIDGLDR